MGNNLAYLYDHLPARFRRADEGLTLQPLKRFLSPFCEELDGYDELFEAFHQSINPETASEEFLNYFLWALFGWGWFPAWFTLARKRSFYSNLATHYARRGTARGIKEFLAEFGVQSRVIVQPQFYGEMTVGDDTWTMDGPLVIVVQIFPEVTGVPEDLTYYGDFTVGEDVAMEPALQITRPDIDALLRFQQPIGHHIIIEEKVAA